MTTYANIETAFFEMFNEVPRLLLRAQLKKRLSERGVDFNASALERLVDHMFGPDEDAVNFSETDFVNSDGSAFDLNELEFGDKDLDDMDVEMQSLVSKMPDIVRSTSRQASKILIKSAIRQWYEDANLRQSETNAFAARLKWRWRNGLVPLNLLVEIASEYGASLNQRLLEANDNKLKVKQVALFKLHMRGCQVTREIIVLLEAGLADGAAARWRTLFEIAVVASVISKSDELTAEKYLAHDIVDMRKSVLRYEETRKLLSLDPFPAEDWDHIQSLYEQALAKYGETFGNEYGWAADALGQKNPRFARLIEFADREGELTFYKTASFNIHANSRSLFYRLSDMPSHEGVIAGASNSGLDSPGIGTAFTFTALTTHLLTEQALLEDSIIIQAMTRLRNLAQRGFREARNQLEEDDRFGISLAEAVSGGADLGEFL